MSTWTCSTLVVFFLISLFSQAIGFTRVVRMQQPIVISVPVDSLGRIALEEYIKKQRAPTKWSYQSDVKRAKELVNLNRVPIDADVTRFIAPTTKLAKVGLTLRPMLLARAKVFTEDSRVKVLAHDSDTGATKSLTDYHQESLQFREQEQRREFTWRGPIKLDSTSPLLPNHTLSAFWEDEEGKRIPGKIELEPEAVFEVYPTGPGGGVVIEMRDEANRVVASAKQGRGEPQNAGASRDKQEDSIVVRDQRSIIASFHKFAADGPSANMMSTTNFTKNSSTTEVTVNGDEATTDKVSATDGTYTFTDLEPGSWVILRSQTKGYFPTTSIHQAGDRPQIPLFSEGFLKAMNEVILEKPGLPDSVVFGQVVNGGKPREGYVVTLVDPAVSVEIIYLNSMLIPDRSLQATSGNGYFVILNLGRGFYPLKAQSLSAPEQGGFANVYVEEGAISPLNVELPRDTTRHESAAVLYDAFSGDPEQAEVYFQDQAQSVTVNGAVTFEKKYEGTHLFQAFIRPISEKYADSLVPFSSKPIGDVRLPLIQKHWIEYLVASTRTNLIPGRGMLVVFNGQAVLERVNAEKVFFAPDGTLTLEPVTGGGFVIFNLESDLYFIKNGSSSYRLAPVEPGLITVIPPIHE